MRGHSAHIILLKKSEQNYENAAPYSLNISLQCILILFSTINKSSHEQSSQNLPFLFSFFFFCSASKICRCENEKSNSKPLELVILDCSLDRTHCGTYPKWLDSNNFVQRRCSWCNRKIKVLASLLN